MLDIKYIRENQKEVEVALLKRINKKDFNLSNILKLDEKRRTLLTELENFRAEKNKLSKPLKGGEFPDVTESVKLSSKIKRLNAELKDIDVEYKDLLAALPNIPADDVAAGGKENNKILSSFNKQPKFDFKPKDHIELATSLGLIDYERSVKMSGSGFWTYTGSGALLEWALLNYFMDFHRSHFDYEFIIPPYLLNQNSAFISGHLPKFREDLYWTENEKLCLNATSEMMLGNYHAGEILNAKELPKKYYAFSTCFRREAGAYRTEERGMVRGHQFNKIEMFHLAKPEDSWKLFDELVKYAQELIEGLDLHYNTVQLAAGDTATAMAKTIDLEVWIPSMNAYKEVSSISNALDFQARRGNIRFKNSNSKNDFVHTLNASGLATSRIFPAILEQNQQSDGSVKVPKKLQQYMSGLKVLKQK